MINNHSKHYLKYAILVIFIYALNDVSATAFKYKGSLIYDESISENMYINFDTKDSILIMPFEKYIHLTSIRFSKLYEDGLVDKNYNTNLKNVFVTLKGTREVSEVHIHTKKNVHFFEVKDIEKGLIMHSPSLFINNIVFANVDKKGRIINDYGEEIIGRQVKFLMPKIRYQTLFPDSLVTLNIKILSPTGKLMVNSNSSDKYSYTISFYTHNIVDIVDQSLTSWQSKFGKGYKLEAYDINHTCLASIDIPTKGVLRHIPILVRMDMSDWATRGARTDLPRLNRRQFVYSDLYRRGYIGPFGKDYLITGWKVIEE